MRQAAVAVAVAAAAPPENVVAALAGDGRGYMAKADANVTWEEILFVPSEHGRHRRTMAKFFNHISYGSYRGVGDTAKQGYERGKETASWGAWRDGRGGLQQLKNARWWWCSPSSILSHWVHHEPRPPTISARPY